MKIILDKPLTGGYTLSKHAKVRLQQRGISRQQMELVISYGVPIDDGYVMTKRAALDRITQLKREITLIERLTNVTVIDLNGTIATAYRVSDQRIRRMLGK